MRRYVLGWLLFPLLVPGAVLANTIAGDLSAGSVIGHLAAYSITDGTLYDGSSPASTARGELDTAVTALEGLGPGAAITFGELGGRTLAPDVYISPPATAPRGTLTFESYGNDTALWVFPAPTSITAESGSNVILENTHTGAGVDWATESASATLAGTTFGKNVLPSPGIAAIPASAVPEPSSFWFLALCLAGLAVRQKWPRRLRKPGLLSRMAYRS